MGAVYDHLRRIDAMRPGDKRALMLGGLVIASAVTGLRILPWGIERSMQSYRTLHQHATLLARAHEELASLPDPRDFAPVLAQALLRLAPEVLSGSRLAEAGADLSGRVNLAASRAPAKVNQLDQLPDSIVAGRLGRVRLHAALETDVRGLIAVLRAIDAGDAVLRMERLSVEAPDPGGIARGPEVLKVDLTVSGLYIKPPSPRPPER